MSVFEYIMVMVSVILALTLAQLLRALAEIPNNTKPYWVHSAWVIFVVMSVLQTWWGFWDLNQVDTWTFPAYLNVVSLPIFQFMLAYLLVPASRTPETDWRAHFYAVRRWIFIAMFGLTIFVVLSSWYLIDVPLLHPYRGFQAILAGLALAGAFLSSHKAHCRLVVLYTAVFLISQGTIRMDLGALMAK
jgi:hypothetical protein